MVTSVWLNYIGYFWHGLWSILTVRVRVIQLLVYVRILRHYLECLCVKLRQNEKIIVICYMFDIICKIYWTLMGMDGFPNRRYFYIAGPVSLLPLITIIWHLCYLCDKCKELARNLGCLLCRLKKNEYYISFPCKNVFPLELRFLVTGITATATNLVVLMQFVMLWLEWAGGNV
ncbi:uncharacterized protein LOC128857685 [Anastrepha ludens]|uniref:uncharacterized protein LOC128857685 n=1 Tax=Anastrepha ludens TaxID=28586 RepID=UPI0023AF7633|nr:uncharacterized protein LOC128857685 [Anastrepha ludens]